MRFLIVLFIAFHLIALRSIAATLPHPIYVTLLEVKHFPDDRKLRICIKVSTEDLEDALIADGAPKGMSLKTDSVHPHADQYLEIYYRKKVAFKVNEKALSFDYAGSKNVLDATWTYFEADDICDIKTFWAKCEVLLEVFEQQTTHLRIKVTPKWKNYILDFQVRDEEIRF